jgi:coenzyme F420-reducing hydrogenase delta subunit
MAGTSRLEYPANIRLVRFPCTGRMDPLFVLRAFEQGADGVLISGCHPGDCHYVQGNLVARRRFLVLRTLMSFLGLDERRLHFSWVSASEGGKFVKVVQAVTDAVRSAGPLSSDNSGEVPRIPAVEGRKAGRTDTESTTRALQETARDLLSKRQVGLLVGHEKGTLPGQVVPTVLENPDQAERLVWDPQGSDLAVYVTRLDRREGPLGLVVKKCDVRSVVGLLQEGQIKRQDLVLLGAPCPGEIVNGSLAAKCHTCDGLASSLCDISLDGPSPARESAPAETDPRDEAIAFLDSLPAEDRWRFWQAEFKRCIRCYACRGACSLCYCATCISEKHRPQWISPAIDEAGNTAWNIIRALHLAGRCTGCDECFRACPALIRLDLINRKLVKTVEDEFGYRSGTDPEASPPLADFRLDDPEEFIL